MYHRMLPHLATYLKTLSDSGEDKAWTEADPLKLNPRLRICKYPKGGVFKKHKDANVSIRGIGVSHLTCMAYLSEIEEKDGGATRFYAGEYDKFACPVNYDEIKLIVKEKIQPKVGQMVVFPHHYLHDGELCTVDDKVILRSDVLFPWPK